MAQLQQGFRQLTHAAQVVQPHVVILLTLVKIAVHKHDGLAGGLNQLAALVGLQAHHNQAHGVPRLGDAVNLRGGLGRAQHGVISPRADGVFQRRDHLADKRVLQGELFLAVGIVGNDADNLAVALGQHAGTHIGDVLVLLQLFADELRRLRRHFFQMTVDDVGNRCGGYAQRICDFFDGHCGASPVDVMRVTGNSIAHALMRCQGQEDGKRRNPRPVRRTGPECSLPATRGANQGKRKGKKGFFSCAWDVRMVQSVQYLA